MHSLDSSVPVYVCVLFFSFFYTTVSSRDISGVKAVHTATHRNDDVAVMIAGDDEYLHISRNDVVVLSR